MIIVKKSPDGYRQALEWIVADKNPLNSAAELSTIFNIPQTQVIQDIVNLMEFDKGDL